MNRINQILGNFASAAKKAALLATAFACVTLGSGNLFAREICAGGSTIKDSSGTIVGCVFSTWGAPEKSMCNGAIIFSGPDTSNCHICVKAPYDLQVSNDDFTGLTTSPPVSFSCLKCRQPPDGMTAWWTLDETNGTVHDLTGNLPLDGLVLGGASSVPGQVGNAIHFDGVTRNQYVEIPNDPQLNVGAGASDGSGDVSFDAWVKLDSATVGNVRVIVEKRAFSYPNHLKGYSFYLYNRYLGLQLADDGIAPGYTNYGAPTLVVPADGAWHFVAVSVTRTPGAFNVQFTLDDKPSVNVVPGVSLAHTGDLSNSSPFRIGMGNINNGSDDFIGSIDEVEFFHRAVTAGEWQSIYSAKCYGKCHPQ